MNKQEVRSLFLAVCNTKNMEVRMHELEEKKRLHSLEHKQGMF